MTTFYYPSKEHIKVDVSVDEAQKVRIQKLEQEIYAKDKENREYKEELFILRKEYSELMDTYTKHMKTIDELSKNISELREQIKTKTGEMEDINLNYKIALRENEKLLQKLIELKTSNA